MLRSSFCKPRGRFSNRDSRHIGNRVRGWKGALELLEGAHCLTAVSFTSIQPTRAPPTVKRRPRDTHDLSSDRQPWQPERRRDQGRNRPGLQRKRIDTCCAAGSNGRGRLRAGAGAVWHRQRHWLRRQRHGFLAFGDERARFWYGRPVRVGHSGSLSSCMFTPERGSNATDLAVESNAGAVGTASDAFDARSTYIDNLAPGPSTPPPIPTAASIPPRHHSASCTQSRTKSSNALENSSDGLVRIVAANVDVTYQNELTASGAIRTALPRLRTEIPSTCKRAIIRF